MIGRFHISALFIISLCFQSQILSAFMWESKTPMPTPRWGYTIGEIDGIIYVAGGYNPLSGGHLTAVEAYDPVTDTWIIKAAKDLIIAGRISK